MPEYVRLREEGGTFFFSVVTYKRRLFLTEPLARQCLRTAWREMRARYPFELIALSLMPNHLHTIWTLPEDDTDYFSRWRFLKARFSRLYRLEGGAEAPRSVSRKKRRERGFWQRRYWEHKIRDDEDLRRHFDYIHYNPVKHGLVTWPEQWPWTTFHRYARMGWYGTGWGTSPVEDIKGMECE
jgi:putative transposase